MRYTLSILAIAVMLLLMPGCKKKDSSSLDFTYTGRQHIGYLISFHSNAHNCVWSFGDGSRSTDPNPNHSYSYAALYTVTLIPDNDSAKKITKTILIASANDFTYSGTPAAGHILSFSSNADEGSTYLWDFGDGSSSTEKAPIHVFATNQDFEVSLSINNDKDHIVKKRISIYANGVYLSQLTGNKTWHHIFTDASPFAPYHTGHTMPDVNMEISTTVPSVITINGDSLSYYGSEHSDSVLLFRHSGYNKHINTSLYFNHFTSATDYSYLPT